MRIFKCLVLVLTVGCASQTVIAGGDPFFLGTNTPSLQQDLRVALRHAGLEKAVASERLAVTVVDLSDLHKPRMAGVNGQIMFYSASLPKIAILLAAFQRVEDHQLVHDEALQEQMEAMIRYSSNEAASTVLDTVGRRYVVDLLMSDHYRLYDASMGGGLWVGKPYGKEQAYMRDPIAQTSHGATTLQIARYYYLLETGRLVSPKASLAMKDILSNPGIAHKFVKGIHSIYPQAQIYRKSGTWRDYHSDSAIVEHDGKHYILAAVSHDPKGGEWLERLIVAVDDIIPVRPAEPAPVPTQSPVPVLPPPVVYKAAPSPKPRRAKPPRQR